MGTYLIPRDMKGEGRILFFSYKALLYTVIGLVPGGLFFFIIKPIHLITAWIVMGVFAFIGFSIGTFPMPSAKGMEVTRKTGGEKIDEIIVRYIKFKKKKIEYTFTIKKRRETNEWYRVNFVCGANDICGNSFSNSIYNAKEKRKGK